MARTDPTVSQPCNDCMRSIASFESALNSYIEFAIVFNRDKVSLQDALGDNPTGNELLVKDNMDKIATAIATIKSSIVGVEGSNALSQVILDKAANM